MELLDVDVPLRRGHFLTEKRQKQSLNLRETQCRAYYIYMSTDEMETNMLSNEDIESLGAISVRIELSEKKALLIVLMFRCTI